MSRHCFSSIRWLNRLKNYEKWGVPVGAGTATSPTWDLEQMHSLLAALNNPHSTLKNVVHVVGTKGKGSVAALLDSVLQESGYRVGRYTSPHLVHEGERISVGGTHLTLEGLDSLIDINKPHLEQALADRPGTSYFEVFTALALRHFADSKIDWTIMEAGLGGVSDATNVFKAHQVRATVITTLEEEHLDALGGSLQSIAAAKAGIVHPGTLVVIAPQARMDAVGALQTALQGIPGVRPVWVSQTALVDQGLQGEGDPWGTKQVSTAGSALLPALGESPLHLSMLGRHNVLNASTVATTVSAMVAEGSVGAPQACLRTGLEKARLPGRFDIRWRPSQGSHWLCLDTAHTVVSCEALVSAAQRIFPDRCNTALIVGLAADKDIVGIVRCLALLKPSLVLCVAPESCGLGARGQPAADVSAAFHTALACAGNTQESAASGEDSRQCSVSKLQTVSSMDEALREVDIWAQDRPVSVKDGVANDSLHSARAPLVCVTGSNYVVGAALSCLQSL